MTKTTARVRGFRFYIFLQREIQYHSLKCRGKMPTLGFAEFGCLESLLMLTSAMQGLARKHWIPEGEGEGSRGEMRRFHGDI
jgi:hypothetical protein